MVRVNGLEAIQASLLKPALWILMKIPKSSPLPSWVTGSLLPAVAVLKAGDPDPLLFPWLPFQYRCTPSFKVAIPFRKTEGSVFALNPGRNLASG
jgi:hypothetical protein